MRNWRRSTLSVTSKAGATAGESAPNAVFCRACAGQENKTSGSEFLKAVGNVSQDRAWEVMDELMDTLKIVNEKAYNSVLKN